MRQDCEWSADSPGNNVVNNKMLLQKLKILVDERGSMGRGEQDLHAVTAM